MKIFLLPVFLCLLFISCDKRDILDRPIIADNFQDFMEELHNVCRKIDAETCGYIKGPIVLGLPDAENEGYKPKGDDAYTAQETYKKLNGKTPSELIQLYKGMLLNNLETVRKRDVDIKRNLDILHDSYESTRHHANNIIVSDVMLISDKNIKNMKVGFTVTNRTDLPLTQLVAEAEFYSASDILLGRTKAFVQVLNPNLKPKSKAIIKTRLDSIPDNDLILIRAAQKLKIKVTVASVQTSSQKEAEKNLILSLPYSYQRMRTILDENELLYNDTVNKINAIKAKKGDK